MKKKILGLILAGVMLVLLLPTTALAGTCEASVTAEFGLSEATTTDYPTLEEAFAAAEAETEAFMVTVTLHVDVTGKTKNITVPEGVFLDLNNHLFEPSGTITNNGVIVLYQKNADMLEKLLYHVAGMYGTREELRLPDTAAPTYVIPADTFFSSDINTEGQFYRDIGFALGDGPLVWNADVPAGTQLGATYDLALGGDILAARNRKVKPTEAAATRLLLNDDIAVGSHIATDGEAILRIEGNDDPVSSITANGHKIILNMTGKLVVPADLVFDKNILISGESGMHVSAVAGWEWDTIEEDYVAIMTYSLVKNAGGNGNSTGSSPIQSAQTGDTGILLYGVMAISSVLGMGWVGKKKA